MGSGLYEELKGQYAVSKTLCHKLIPQGKTSENIERNGILEEDEHRAESYQHVKKIIDEYHKKFIEEVLDDISLDDLALYETLYNNPKKTDTEIKQFKKCEVELRKQIAKKLTKHPLYNSLFSKELIKKLLPVFVQGDTENEEKIKEFNNFTTYFKGFNENRKNIYSHEEKATAIAFRLINDNLPKFIDNAKTFKKVIQSSISNEIENIAEALSNLLEGKGLNEFFEISHFNRVLTQGGIDTYNQIIGGYTLEGGTNVKGLNQYIEEYNQKNKKNRIGKFKMLFKQLLTERSTQSFVSVAFQTDQDVVESIQHFHVNLERNVIEKKEGKDLKDLITDLKSYDLSKIHIKKDAALTGIAQALYGDWTIIDKAIIAHYNATYTGKKKKDTSKYEEERAKYIKKQESYSIQYLNECIGCLTDDKRENIENLFIKFSYKEGPEERDYYEVISEKYDELQGMLSTAKEFPMDLVKDKKTVQMIKAYLDSVKELQWFIKPLLGKGDEASKDERFYGELTSLWQEIDKVTPLYNRVRDYVARKPYSQQKVKVNFGNPELLGGWPVGREMATSSLLFKDDKFYYLGIMDKDWKAAFKAYPKPIEDTDTILKMKYLQVADPQKDVQNLMVIDGKTEKKNGRKEITGEHAGENLRLEELKNSYLPSEINRIRQTKSYSKLSDNFNREDLNAFIAYYKERVKDYYCAFEFAFREPDDYRDFGDFTDHVNEQAYQIQFEEISRAHLDRLVDEGKLYLFKIYNKDFSEYSEGTPNLHTLYWKMLFDERNLAKVVYKLNGEAEVFYRRASIKREITHPANEAITNKNPDNKNKTSVFEYDLIKNKRYTIDQFELHVPITLNFISEGNERLNEKVNQTIKGIEDIHVIGIDRGERNLLYITVIDSAGNIKEQLSLNEIINEHNGQAYKTDYHKLLSDREADRDKARKSWKTINSIKELKEGYLSQVIHKITKLMIKYQAIVVLEDLNFGFIRGRQKFEKQVYQKFEKKLIDKLNYLVDKKEDPMRPGGLLQAYQLTNKFESFKNLGKQSGVLYYIPAWNTSKIDPTTGFVNFLYIKYETRDAAKEFMSKFEAIGYNLDADYFEFDIDYTKFTHKAEGTRTDWTLCSFGERIESYRDLDNNNKWACKEVDITQAFKELFEGYGIDYRGNKLKEAIIAQNEKTFFVKLFHLIKLMLQMRNSKTGTAIDYLISPVKNRHGKFYDSRKVSDKLPKDADANGAYNIARKGLWIVEQIKQTDEAELGKLKLAITNKEWLHYAQKHVK